MARHLEFLVKFTEFRSAEAPVWDITDIKSVTCYHIRHLLLGSTGFSHWPVIYKCDHKQHLH